jgi:hypothetical protein
VKWTAEGCNGPCNHYGKTDVDTSYAQPSKYPRRAVRTDDSCNGSCNRDIITNASDVSDYLDDEDDNDPSDYLDNEDDDKDDLMEPAPVPASKPASEVVIEELKQQCINTINNKLAACIPGQSTR